MNRLIPVLMASAAIACQPASAQQADTTKAAVPMSGMGIYRFGGVPGLGYFNGGTVKPQAVPLAGANLPPSGVAAGTYGSATMSPVVTLDATGRATAVQQQLFAAILDATNDAATNGGLTLYTFKKYLSQHNPIEAWGGRCNDPNFDNGPVINRAMYSSAYGAAGFSFELPQGQYCYFQTPIKMTQPNGSFGGLPGMWTGNLVYNGAATTGDLMIVGNGVGATAQTGSIDQRLVVHDLTITVNTKMTSGAIIRQANTGFVEYNHVSLSGNGNAWDDFRFEQIDHTTVTNYLVAGAQHDGFAVSGNGQDNVGNASHAYGAGQAFTGPQYDLIVDIGKISECHTGVHMGGGFDNAWWDHASITNNDINALIDNGIPVSQDGTTWPNQEVMFGPQISMDNARFAGVVINDPKASPAIYATIVIKGPITNTTGAPSLYPALYPTPAVTGVGIDIKAYPGGNIIVQAPYLQGFLAGSQAAAIYDEDQSAYLSISPETQIINSTTGINATASWGRLLNLPQFVSVAGTLGSNVLAPTQDFKGGSLVNVAAPGVSISNNGNAVPAGLFFTGSDLGIRAQGTGNNGCIYLQNNAGSVTSTRVCPNAGAQVPKLAAAPSSGPGAGFLSLFAVPGTTAGTCKLQTQSGTSATPATIMDNVGSGC